MSTHPYRILVTGSRKWTDHATIAQAISDWLESKGTSIGGAYPIPVVVHGGQRTWHREGHAWIGADWCAGAVARNWGFGEERHPADWQTEGLAAGPLRNQRMVDLGADVCLAFPIGRSRGTRDCVRRAEAAGIPVIVTEGP